MAGTNGREIVVAGGYTDGNAATPSVEIFGTSLWGELAKEAPNMKEKREFAAAAMLGQSVALFSLFWCVWRSRIIVG